MILLTKCWHATMSLRLIFIQNSLCPEWYRPLLWRRTARRVHPCVSSRRHHVGLRSSRSHVDIRAHAWLLSIKATSNNHEVIWFSRKEKRTLKWHRSDHNHLILFTTIVHLPSFISIRVLLPLAHWHVGHWAWWTSVILFPHSTVGAGWHELFPC